MHCVGVCQESQALPRHLCSQRSEMSPLALAAAGGKLLFLAHFWFFMS